MTEPRAFVTVAREWVRDCLLLSHRLATGCCGRRSPAFSVAASPSGAIWDPASGGSGPRGFPQDLTWETAGRARYTQMAFS